MKYLKNIICAICIICGLQSCADMLDTDSSRQNFDPSLAEKSDSLFYVFGIFEAMQHLADQYVLQGELRGDLVATTQYTDNNLRQLADFSATTANKYDSAYVYYRVINNCNYYIAHRNTELYTGSKNVVINEYAAVKAIRAWAYLQLARNWGKVPFFTEPLTKISQIDEGNFPELDLNGIVGQLAPDLEQYTGLSVPVAYNGALSSGNTNYGGSKNMYVTLCFIPVDVILGEMYLEMGDYHRAATHYVTYLTTVAQTPTSFYLASTSSAMTSVFMNSDKLLLWQEMLNRELPLESDRADDGWKTPGSWFSMFNSTADRISYIPMAPSAQYGPTTDLPSIFGLDFYVTSDEVTGSKYNSIPLMEKVQLVPSDSLRALSDSTDYYYYVDWSTSADYDSIAAVKLGDMRLSNATLELTKDNNSTQVYITKYYLASIPLYRTSTVLLHLAEAFNRLGYYDLAFAILKDGISPALIKSVNPDGTPAADAVPYMSETSKALLTSTYPLLSYADKFPLKTAMGVHCHGTGKAASDMAKTTYRPDHPSPYSLSRMVGMQIGKTEAFLNLTKGTLNTKQDTINAIEDMLCDEYALEFAFEGNRYFDLLRLSNHKNGHAVSSSAYNGSPAAYGARYGTRWLQKKLEGRGWDESKRYLPFK